jgi:predicted nucleotide-binding protein
MKMDNDKRGIAIWREYTVDVIWEEILLRANVESLDAIKQCAQRCVDFFANTKLETIATFDAMISLSNDRVIVEQRNKLTQLESHTPATDLALAILPRQMYSMDRRARAQGACLPPHLTLRCQLEASQSSSRALQQLESTIRHTLHYLETTQKIKGNFMPKTTGKVFIGHGRSMAWRDLKDFIQDRLKLEWDEFNRETVAGRTTKERLEEMLDTACIAFLVMTAEDEHSDGSFQARANVIHEAGLFQGRLGFQRAIILLEDGCAEFSNIQGLTQIRFTKGQLGSKFEEIRKVLEREGIMSS